MSSHPFGGGSAVAHEYQALLNLGGVTEAQVRQALRCNATLRNAMRDALRELPGIRDAAQDGTLVMAAELARGEHGKPAAESLFATLSDAARARVVKGAELPSTIKTWAQLSRRAAEYKSELLISTLIHGEHNAEAAAQQPEQLAQTEMHYARLSDEGKVRVTSRATTFGQAMVPWAQLLHFAQSRNEVVDLTALVAAQYAKERQAEGKRQAAAKAKEALLGTPLPTKAADPHTKRVTNHKARRPVAKKV